MSNTDKVTIIDRIRTVGHYLANFRRLRAAGYRLTWDCLMTSQPRLPRRRSTKPDPYAESVVVGIKSRRTVDPTSLRA